MLLLVLLLLLLLLLLLAGCWGGAMVRYPWAAATVAAAAATTEVVVEGTATVPDCRCPRSWLKSRVVSNCVGLSVDMLHTRRSCSFVVVLLARKKNVLNV